MNHLNNLCKIILGAALLFYCGNFNPALQEQTSNQKDFGVGSLLNLEQIAAIETDDYYQK